MEAKNDKRKKTTGGTNRTDKTSSLAVRSKRANSRAVGNKSGASGRKSSQGLRTTRRPNSANTKPASRKSEARTRTLDASRKKPANVERIPGNKTHTEGAPGRLSNPRSKHVRKHLRKISRCYAYMCHVVRAFGKPTGTRTDSFSLRAKAGDKTLLHDCVSRCIRDLEIIAEALDAEIEPAPTEFMPGTEKKIEVLRERFKNGQKIFSKQDVSLHGGD